MNPGMNPVRDKPHSFTPINHTITPAGMELTEALVHKIYPHLYDRAEDLVSLDHSCLQQAWYNQSHGYRDLNLKLVLGSLGIGIVGPHFEFGGKSWSVVTDFLVQKQLNRTGQRTVDAHIWLEDGAGMIYDMVPISLIGVALIKKKKLGVVANERVEGMTAEALAELGLHYIPAPASCQSILLQMQERMWRAQYQSFLPDFPRLPALPLPK